jgi:hypothetical protein
VKVRASPFPRVLSERELAHRQRMLAHLTAHYRFSSTRQDGSDNPLNRVAIGLAVQ